MNLVFEPSGVIRCLYGEVLDLHQLGHLRIQRASHVEPDEHGQWWADLSPVNGPHLGPFARRTEALSAEIAWLEEHWLR
jgi:hypothetical protein